MKNILVPTDFSAEAHHAYEVALQLAKQIGGNATLLHVLEAPLAQTANFSTFGGPVNGSELPNSNGMDQLFTLKLMEVTKHRMHTLKEEAGTLAAGVPVQDTVELLSLGDGILNAIQKHGIDLVVMSAHAQSALDEFFSSSTAEHTIRLAPCPVLTVKHQQEKFEVRNIVFPSDFSAEAGGAISGLREVQETFPNARLYLLHVATSNNDPLMQQQLQAFAEQAQLSNWDAVVINADHTGSGIEEYAQRVQADLG